MEDTINSIEIIERISELVDEVTSQREKFEEELAELNSELEDCLETDPEDSVLERIDQIQCEIQECEATIEELDNSEEKIELGALIEL